MTVSLAQAQIFFLALTRILALIIQVPVLGGRMVPDTIKIGLGFLLTIVIIPWQPLPAEAAVIPTLAFAIAIGRELLIGTLAGFAAALIFAALEIAGNLMGLGSGFAAGQILNPTLGGTGSSLDQIFVMMAILLFLIMDGHHAFLIGIQRTFTLLPVNNPLPGLPVERLLTITSGLITAGVQMSLPVVGTLLLTDVTLGLLARVAPQVQVFFLGIPLKVGIGLLVLALTLTILFPTFTELFGSITTRMLALIGV